MKFVQQTKALNLKEKSTKIISKLTAQLISSVRASWLRFREKQSLFIPLAVFFAALEDRDEMYDSLTNQERIDVLLDDIFIGVESIKRKDKTQQMSIANFIPHNRAYGVAYGNNVFEEGISDCLSNVIKFRYNDVLKITSNYIKDSKVR